MIAQILSPRCMRRLFVVCAGILAAAAFSGCAKVGADELVAEARSLADKGDPDSIQSAIHTLDPLVRKKNTHVSVTNYYLALNIRAGQGEQVLELAEKNAQQAPTDYLAHYLLAKVYYELGRLEEALKAAKAAASINPDSLNALTLAARLAGRENDPEANLFFTDLAGRDASTVNRMQLYNEWGLWLAQQGKNYEALAMFNTGVKATSSPHPVLILNTAIVKERVVPKAALHDYLVAKSALPIDGYVDTHLQIQARIRELSR